MKRAAKVFLVLGACALLNACGGGGGVGDKAAELPLASTRPAAVGDRQLPATEGLVDARLRRATGEVEVWVALDQDSLALTRAKLADATGTPRVRAAVRRDRAQAAEPAEIARAMAGQRAAIQSQQAAVAGSLRGMGAQELARVSVAHNAIAVKVDAARVGDIARLPGVKAVRPVVEYEMHLGETVAYVGGAAVQAQGADGTGVLIAVLDSGIDFTHRNFGGPGTAAFYTTCYAQRDVAPSGACADYFGPGAPKVTAGFDFVGESWPTLGARSEDPNPIDFQGHGTHVADIAAGRSADGTHKGMAPGAKLMAVKVCSAIATSCNGIALLRGMDFALDPNGDGDLSDAADVINMSLGASYGQIEDDLSLASSNAVALGVVVVASAGNSADRPYVTGSPAATPAVISVAQTQVPSAVAYPLVVTGITPSVINNTALVDWAPLGSGFSGAVARLGRGCPAGSIAAGSPADPYFNGNDPSGKVALIDRGACAVSLKVDRATKAGAVAVIIANNVAGDPPSFSFGGGDLPLAPTIIISLADGNRIKAALGATGVNPAVVATVNPAVSVPLIGSMVASSSRGPNVSFNQVKPEIGAPGGSVSAIVGTGAATGAFGGTSGSAPMVAGAAALLLSGRPDLEPMQIKALLMNGAETEIYINPATQPGVLAPISRIGAGELRVDRAATLGALAWDQASGAAALSFGAVEADRQTVVARTLTLHNLGNTAKQFQIASSFRYANDRDSAAVSVQAPSVVNVPANGSADVSISLVINPTRLHPWALNGGSQGGNGAALSVPEYDGFITLVAGNETLSVPWHVLPRKSARTTAAVGRGINTLTLVNTGAELGAYDLFSLVGRSARAPAAALPQPGDDYAFVDLKSVGVRFLPAEIYGTNLLEFAVSVYGRNAHPLYPRGIEIDIDVDGNGTVDFFVFQRELTGFAQTGQSAVFVQRVGTTTASAFFFNDADLNSGNMIFTIPLSVLGVGPSQTLNFEVYGFDNYFTGFVTDVIGGMRFTPANSRFGAGAGTFPFGEVNRGASARVPFRASPGVTAAQSSELGLLLMYRRNAGEESQEFVLPAP